MTSYHCVTVKCVYHNLHVALNLILRMAAVTLNTFFVLQDPIEQESLDLWRKCQVALCVYLTIFLLFDALQNTLYKKNKASLYNIFIFCWKAVGIGTLHE